MQTFEKRIKMCTLAIIDQAIDAANSIKKTFRKYRKRKESKARMIERAITTIQRRFRQRRQHKAAKVIQRAFTAFSKRSELEPVWENNIDDENESDGNSHQSHEDNEISSRDTDQGRSEYDDDPIVYESNNDSESEPDFCDSGERESTTFSGEQLITFARRPTCPGHLPKGKHKKKRREEEG